MGDVGFRMIVKYTVLVNCTGDMTVVFFDSILKILTGLTYVAEGSTNEFNPPGHPDHPQSHLIIPSNSFSRPVCLAN